jgi:hypothetical protein
VLREAVENEYETKGESNRKGRQRVSRNIIRPDIYFVEVLKLKEARGGAVVEALRYKPEGRGFDSR